MNVGSESHLQDLPPILDARDVAKAFKIAERVAARWLAEGRLPSVKIGKRRYCRREDLLRCLQPERPGR